MLANSILRCIQTVINYYDFELQCSGSLFLILFDCDS